MRRTVILCALFFACSGGDSGGAGASGPAAAPARPGVPRVTDPDSAKAAIGKTVQVAGTALNAKLGPVVETGGLVIYCMGRQEWSADQLGKPITVTGKLEQTDDFKAQEGPDGMHSAGTGGNDWVIRDCAVDEGTPAKQVDQDQGGW
jgi:hypothetical protein